jgi:hypothetical protein
MSGTHGALRLIELTSARLCSDLGGLVGLLDPDLPVEPTGPAGQPSRKHWRARHSRDTDDPAGAAARRLGPLRGAHGEPLSLAQVKRLAAGLPEHVSVNLSALRPHTVFPAAAGSY